MDTPTVTYVLPNRPGGVFNIVRHLLKFRVSDGLQYGAVLTANRCAPSPPPPERLGADLVNRFDYGLPIENLHAVLDRLHRAIPPGPGVLVASDLLELAMLHVHDPGKTVVHLLHGDIDYYYDLAVRHESVIDVFVGCSRAIFNGLRRRLPHRLDDIRHLPYGVPLAGRTRTASPGPLRLLFAGRLEHGQKGVFDLPLIDAQLRARQVDVAWTVIGAGPDEEALRAQWSSMSPHFMGQLTNEQTVACAADHDVFVLPTRFEGFPLALLEAMSAGLVPVVSDIASGVPEAVLPEQTGLLAPTGDISAFADAIASLARDREMLERLSQAARAHVDAAFRIEHRVRAYQELYADWARLRRRAVVAPLPYGSRLDHPWIPNALVRLVRGARRATS